METAIDTYNRYLEEAVMEWKEEQTDSNIMLFDLHSYHRLILGYPELFGLTETYRYDLWVRNIHLNLGRQGFA